MIIKPAYMEAFKYIYSQIKEPKHKKIAMRSLAQFIPPGRIDEITGIPSQIPSRIYKDTDDLQRDLVEQFLDRFFQYNDDMQQQIITNLFKDIPVDSYANVITECIELAIDKNDSKAVEEHLHKIQEIIREQYDLYYEKMSSEKPLEDIETVRNQMVFRFIFDKAPQKVRDMLINEIEPFIKRETIYKLTEIKDSRLPYIFFDWIHRQSTDRQKEFINDVISDVPYSTISAIIDRYLFNYLDTEEDVKEIKKRLLVEEMRSEPIESYGLPNR